MNIEICIIKASRTVALVHLDILITILQLSVDVVKEFNSTMYRMSELSGNSIDKFVDKYGNPLKPKSERIKETITLLKKLKELGIPTIDAGYVEIKRLLDEWVQGGEKWSGIVEFSRFDQKVELEIPTKPGKELMVKLLAPKVKRRV